MATDEATASSHVDQELLEGFLDEVEGYLPGILEGIESIGDDPQGESVALAYRLTHTIAGAAAMVGLEELGRASDAIETVLLNLLEEEIVPTSRLIDSVGELASRVQVYVNAVRAAEDPAPLPVDSVEAAFRDALEQEDSPAEGTLSDETTVDPLKDPESDSLSPELVEAFQLEAAEHLSQIAASLSALQADPLDRGPLQDLRRTVHTLKGASGVVGQSGIARLSHRMEDLLDQLVASGRAAGADALGLMLLSAEHIEELLLGEVEPSVARAQTTELVQGYARLLADGTEPSESPRTDQIEPRQSHALGTSRRAGEVVRVPLERLDGLAALVTELAVSRSIFEERLREFEQDVRELKQSSERLRGVSSKLETDYEVKALSRGAGFDGGPILPVGLPANPQEAHGFDELEFDRYTEFHLLTRELAEAAADVRTVSSEMAVLVSEFQAIMKRQGRTAGDIQEALKLVRTVPVTTLSARLQRAVRTLAREQDKAVDLILEGSHVELDKAMLEALADPLMHLIRNAVDHGIEPPDRRQELDKPERGVVHVRVEQHGGEIVIMVGDDGAGLDPERIRSEVESHEHLSGAAVKELTTHDLYQMIFLPGLSTSAEVSEVSGRGIGLDIVQSTVRQLGGDVRVDSAPGEGTWFTIHLPMTVAVTRALLVTAGNEPYAIPMDSISRVIRVGETQAERLEESRVIEDGNEVFPALRLDELLGLPAPAADQTPGRNVLLVNAGVHHLALMVDEVVGAREIVVMSLGPYLERVRGLSGVSLLGNGSVVLILNPADLLDRMPARRSPVQPTQADSSLLVMVVDDSLSVRRVVSRLIESNRWESVQARDGVEALELLETGARPPDAILVDIEMPRMDGYELMAAVRAHPTHHSIPLVVLTSRAGQKHRRKAMEAGASDYVTKPYRNETLLSAIQRVVQESISTVPA